MNFSHLIMGFNPMGRLNFFQYMPFIFPTYARTVPPYATAPGTTGRPTGRITPTRRTAPVQRTAPVTSRRYTAPSRTTTPARTTAPARRVPTRSAARPTRTPSRVKKPLNYQRRISMRNLDPALTRGKPLRDPVGDFGDLGALSQGTKDLMLYAALAAGGFAAYKIWKGSKRPRRRTLTETY